MSFWKELSRRNVVKVGIAYAVAAWLIIHPVDIIFPILHLPEWSITLVTAFLIILFPLVLIFSWVYEVTPKGLKRTKDVPLSKSTTHLTGRKLNYIIIGLLVLAVALLIFDNFYRGRRTVETKQVPVVGEVETAKKTIAVLPFENLSSDPEQAYFVDGLSEELLNTLTQIPDLLVTARTSSFSFKDSDKTVQEIASVLGVENILEGSVRKAGNALRITAQLVRAVDGFHLWSKTYDRELKDIFVVQEDIASAVATELKATLGIGKSFKQLGGTENVEAYDFYLVAKGQMIEANLTSLNLALGSINNAILLDPKFALAWTLKSEIHSGLSVLGPSKQASVDQDEALHAAKKAIELEPNLAAGYYQLSFSKLSRGEFIESEYAFRKNMELKTEISGSETLIGGLPLAVGYFKRANELLETLRRKDPLNKIARGEYMLSFAFLGDINRAEEEYKHGRELFGDDWFHGNTFITYIHLGFDHVLINDIVYSSPIFNLVKKHLDSPKEGVAELRRICTNGDNLSSEDLVEIGIFAAYFDDPELAMDAMEKAINIQTSGVFHFWFPVMRETRQKPRFKQYIKKIGLVDYWNKFGWPDMCHQLENGDFVCD